MTLFDSHPDRRKPSWPELVLEIKKVVSKRRDIEWWTQDFARRRDPGFKMRDRDLGFFFHIRARDSKSVFTWQRPSVLRGQVFSFLVGSLFKIKSMQ